MKTPRLRQYVLLLWSTLLSAAVLEAAAQLNSPKSGTSTDTLWKSHIEPLFSQNCFKCHGGVKQKGGLDLRTMDSILKGSDSGAVFVSGNSEKSLIYQYVLPGADPHMPPKEDQQLTSEEISLIEAWIQSTSPGHETSDWKEKTGLSLITGTTGGAPGSNRKSWMPYWTMPPAKVINRFIRFGWNELGIRASKVSDDLTFLRRLYLDLVGRIPSAEETETFVKSSTRKKRNALVDELLSSDEYARHMREVFDVVLMNGREGRRRGSREANGWHEFLEVSFRANRPWDEIVRAIVLARPANTEEQGAIWFLYERKNDHQAMAEAVAPVAYGLQVECAQCHNHPLVREIEQRHYWGLVAAMNRSKNVEAQQGIGIAESAIGGFVKFTNLENESQEAVLIFPDGTFIDEKRPPDDAKEKDDPSDYLVPPPPEKEKPEHPAWPKFSRREQLADAVTSDNPLLARSFVNRIWALLMGRGFVHPVDEMDSTHPPSHPELLNWLALDFERSGYDIKRLIRSILLSRPYQLESRPLADSPIPSESFSFGLEKPLSAEVLYRSILVATGNEPDADGNLCGTSESEIRQVFESLFPEPFPDQYNANLSQAMFFSNNSLLNELLKPRDGNTAARLLEAGTLSDRVQLAFTTVFGRSPDVEELDQSVAFLKAYDSDQEAGIRFFLWALLASAEFQMNH